MLSDHDVLPAEFFDLADAPVQEVTLIARRGTDDITADGNGGIEKPGLAALRDLPVDRFRLIIVTALAPGPRNSCGALDDAHEVDFIEDGANDGLAQYGFLVGDQRHHVNTALDF